MFDQTSTRKLAPGTYSFHFDRPTDHKPCQALTLDVGEGTYATACQRAKLAVMARDGNGLPFDVDVIGIDAVSFASEPASDILAPIAIAAIRGEVTFRCVGEYTDADCVAIFNHALETAQDCQWQDDDSDTLAPTIGGYSHADIVRNMAKHYDGGMPAMVRDALAANVPNPVIARFPASDGGTIRQYANGMHDAVDGRAYSLSPGFETRAELETWIADSEGSEDDNEPERWTVITAEGLLMFADIFTESEARAHVEANPLTPSGDTPQYAVPASVGHACQNAWTRIQREHDAMARAARVANTAKLMAGEPESDDVTVKLARAEHAQVIAALALASDHYADATMIVQTLRAVCPDHPEVARAIQDRCLANGNLRDSSPQCPLCGNQSHACHCEPDYGIPSTPANHAQAISDSVRDYCEGTADCAALPGATVCDCVPAPLTLTVDNVQETAHADIYIELAYSCRNAGEARKLETVARFIIERKYAYPDNVIEAAYSVIRVARATVAIEPGYVLPNGATVIASSMRNANEYVLLAMTPSTHGDKYVTWKCSRPGNGADTCHGHYFDSIVDAAQDWHSRP